MQFFDGNTLTKSEVESGLITYEKREVEAITKAKADKAALLAKLGITEEEARLLLS